MTILTDFKAALTDAISDYQNSRPRNFWPFVQSVSLARANDIQKFQDMINKAESASLLREDIESKLDTLKIDLSKPITSLDTNALKVRINKVLNMTRFAENKIDRKENRELLQRNHELDEEQKQLIRTIRNLEALHPSKFDELETLLNEHIGRCHRLEKKVEDLTVTSESIAYELEVSKQQVSALEAKLEDNKVERDTLSRNNIELLRQTRELKEANEALKAKVADLQKELDQSANKAPVNDVKKPPAPLQGTSFLPSFFRRN